MVSSSEAAISSVRKRSEVWKWNCLQDVASILCEHGCNLLHQQGTGKTIREWWGGGGGSRKVSR